MRTKKISRHIFALRVGSFSNPLADVAIAVAIAGILLAAALPAYREHMATTCRADAKSALLAAAQAMESYYTKNGKYDGATLGATEGVSLTTSPHGYYALSITNQDAHGFSLLATRAGARCLQASDKCGDYTYNQDGVMRVISAARDKANCW